MKIPVTRQMKDNSPVQWKHSRGIASIYIYLVAGLSSWGHGCLVLGAVQTWCKTGGSKENLRGGSKSSAVAVVTRQEVVNQPHLLHPSPVIVFDNFLYNFFFLNFGRIWHHFSQYENAGLSEMVFQHILDDKHRVPPGCCRSQGLLCPSHSAQPASWPCSCVGRMIANILFCIKMRSYFKVRWVSHKMLLLGFISSAFPCIIFISLKLLTMPVSFRFVIISI